MIRAIFFDVDGTLMSFHSHTISPRTLAALARLRERGILLFLSTGRHPKMLDGVEALFHFDGHVCLSGQLCFCGEKVLRSRTMDPPSVERLAAVARENLFPCIFLEEQDIYINYTAPDTLHFVEMMGLEPPPVADPRRCLGRPLYQAIAFLPVEREYLLLQRAPQLKTTRWHPSFLDVIPQGGGKDKGMDALLEHFSLSPEECMAFGDGENDLTMLRHAGIGVAMGSASPQVRQGADYVTGTVDEDGVCAALEHFGLL